MNSGQTFQKQVGLDRQMTGEQRLAIVLLFTLILSGCATPRRFHQQMQLAARPQPGIQQTQLAHIGQVITDEGTFQVATQSRVLTGMMAPRGIATRLLLFDASAKLVAAFEASLPTPALPLWCEGSRLYLQGFGTWHFADTLQPVEADPRLVKHRGNFLYGNPYPDSITGNVLDFKRGPSKPFLTRETLYGSSGGIEDDAWELKDKQKR